MIRSAYLTEVKSAPAVRYPAFDAAFHDHWAHCLASGDWSAPEFYSDPRIHETPFFRPPGYPYFLAGLYALSGQDPIVVRVVQMLIGLASCVLAFLFGRSVFGRGVGLIVAALMSCYWIFIYFEGELLAPVLLIFLLLATLNVLARWLSRTTYTNTIATGVLLGLSALVRPNALVLAPIALVWIWWIARRRRDPGRFRVALLGLPLGVLLAIAPATIRNYVVAGDLVMITSNVGVNFYIGNNEYTDCVSANVPILGEITTLGSWTCFDEPAIVSAVERIEGRPLKSSEVSRFFAAKAFAHIAEHPGRTAELMGKKTLLFWGPAEISNNKVIHFDRANSRVLRFLPGFPLALALSIIGLLLFFLELRTGGGLTGTTTGPASRRFELTVPLVAFVIVYFASYLPFFIAGRYRVPVIPALLLFGAYGIERVWLMATARRISAAVWIGVLTVIYLGTSHRIVDYRPDLGMWHFDRGDAYRKQGKTELAHAEFRQAVEKSDKPTPVALNNLGVSLDQLGYHEEAVERFEQALEIKPNYLEARWNLVAVLVRANRTDAVYEHLMEIVRFNPRDTRARFYLGVSLLEQSKFDKAVGQLSEAVRLDPSQVNAQYCLAQALAKSGRPKEAIARYGIALRLAEDHLGARFELAELLAQAGKNKEAITHLTRVLEIKPDHSAARELLNRLESD